MIARPDPLTIAAAAITDHEAATDPHPGYQRESEKAAANGYASLDSGTKVPVAQLGTGTPDATMFLRGDRSWSTAIQGSTGSTDRAVLLASGTGGGEVQASGLTLNASAQLVRPMIRALWSMGVAFPVYTFPATDSESILELPYVLRRTTGGTNRRAGVIRIDAQRVAGVWTLVVADTGITVTFAPPLTWAMDGDTLTLSIGGTAGNAGEFAYGFTEHRYAGNLRDGA